MLLEAISPVSMRKTFLFFSLMISCKLSSSQVFFIKNIFLFVVLSLSGVIALFCRQYDIIKDNEPNNNKDKAKNSSECSTPEHPTGGLLRSKV